MKTKFALVLSGGGFNGAFQVGALQQISEKWKSITGLSTPMKFDIVAGVSAGAINGSLVAMNQLDILRDLWVNRIAKLGASEIYTSEFIDTQSKQDKLKFQLDLRQLAKRLKVKIDLKFDLFKKIGMIFSEEKRKEFLNEVLAQVSEAFKSNLRSFRSIADNAPLLDKLKVYLDRSKIVDTTFLCGFVSLNTGFYHSVAHNSFCSNTDFVNGVLASSAIPVIWNPVDKIEFMHKSVRCVSHNNVDGGLMNVSPLGDVIKLISEDEEECRYKIIVINCNSGIPRYEPFSNKSIGAIAARSIYELTLTEVFNNDINQFLQINDLAKQVEAVNPGIVLHNQNNRPIKAFDAIVIGPDKDFELGSPLVANEKLIKMRMDHGYSQAKRIELN